MSKSISERMDEAMREPLPYEGLVGASGAAATSISSLDSEGASIHYYKDLTRLLDTANRLAATIKLNAPR